MPMNLQTSRAGTRCLCALFLLLLSVGPWLTAFSLRGEISEASLQACCRTHGKHKCFMQFKGQGTVASNSASPVISQVLEHCPYKPALTMPAHCDPFGKTVRNSSWIGPRGSASLVAITTQPLTSFRSRANFKRGPPSPAFSLVTTNDKPAARQTLPIHWRLDASTKTDVLTLCYGASSGLDHPA
jgi:hypothetical protein